MQRRRGSVLRRIVVAITVAVARVVRVPVSRAVRAAVAGTVWAAISESVRRTARRVWWS